MIAKSYKLLYLLLLLLTSLTFYSCTHENKTLSSHIDRFYKNQTQFNELTKSLRSDTSTKMKFGETIIWSNFDTIVKKQLSALDIKEVYVFSWEIKQRQFDFITNWDKGKLIHIYYNSFDTLETQKGFYKKIDSNELYGLGNSWAIWTQKK